MILEVGNIVKFKGMHNKRLHGVVAKAEMVGNEENYSIKPIYLPSPKSRLRKKNPFSQNKHKLKL